MPEGGWTAAAVAASDSPYLLPQRAAFETGQPISGGFGSTGRGSRMLGHGHRAVVASTASSILVVAALASLFFFAPGSAAVRHTFFSPHALWQSFIGNPKAGYYSVGAALWLNVRMFLIAEPLILLVSLVVALIRQSQGPILFPFRALATIYVDVFRGVPLLLVVYLLGFGIPALGVSFISDQSATFYGVTALVLSYSAYVSEVFRAGLNSVHPSQAAAARSLGLSRTAALRYVILPQAVRTIIPPLLNDFISLQKDTALVGVLGAIETLQAANLYGSSVFNYSSFVVAAILFLLLTIPLARFTDHLIARDRTRRLATIR